VQGDFQGKVRLENIDPPNGYTMQVDGRGAAGFVKATGNLALSPDGERTRLVYDGEAQVGGKLAAVGQRLVESSTRAIIAQSLDGLNAAVKARTASRTRAAESPGSAPPEPAYEKPSQAEFARGVARQVVRDLIPPAARKTTLVILVILILIVLYLVLT
jgi:hypothetical protein